MATKNTSGVINLYLMTMGENVSVEKTRYSLFNFKLDHLFLCSICRAIPNTRKRKMLVALEASREQSKRVKEHMGPTLPYSMLRIL